MYIYKPAPPTKNSCRVAFTMEIEKYHFGSTTTANGTNTEADLASNSTNDDGCGGGHDEVENGMYMVWEDLSVVLPNFGNGHSRRLLDGLTGYAEPGKIMAIMGPSGSGKSTLLDSLAGALLYLSLSLSPSLTFFVSFQTLFSLHICYFWVILYLLLMMNTCIQVLVYINLVH